MNPFNFALQPCDCILFQHQSDLGKIIQKVTKSWASHAALCIWGPDYLIEADDLVGVHKTALSIYLRDTSFVRIQVRRAINLKIADAVNKALALNGHPYGTLDLIKIYGYDHGWNDLDTPTLDGEDKLICSELVARALAAGGVDVRPQFGVRSFGMVTPAMLSESTVLKVVYDWVKEEVHEVPQPVPCAPDPPTDH